MQNHIPQVWQVSRAASVPLYKQLADNIKWSIHLGNVQNGWKLPSVRALAKELDVSVDTVRAAYKILEDSGLAVSRPHHGTEVIVPSDTNGLLADVCKAEEDAFSNIINRCFDKGMEKDQIESLFARVLDQELQSQSEARILFVECNEEDSRRFREQLSSILDVRVDIAMVDDLDNLCKLQSEMNQRYKAIVTTFFHYSTVMLRAQGLRLPVYGVVTEMSGEALQNIRRFKSGQKVGVIIRPSHSLDYLMGLITNVRDDLDIRCALLGNRETLDDVISWADVFIVSRPCEREVLIRRHDAEILYFCDSINAQSIGILRENLNYLLVE